MQNASQQTKSLDVQAFVQKLIANKKVLIIIGVILLIILLFSRCGKDGGNGDGGKGSLGAISGTWSCCGSVTDQYSFGYFRVNSLEISKEGIKGDSSYADYAVSAKDVKVEKEDGIKYYIYHADMTKSGGMDLDKGIEYPNETMDTQIRLFIEDEGTMKYEIYLEGDWHPVARYEKE